MTPEEKKVMGGAVQIPQQYSPRELTSTQYTGKAAFIRRIFTVLLTPKRLQRM
jgi:hypothetical protein